MSSTPTSPLSRTRLTPSETTRSASTSRPESVSSRTAIFGLSSSIWRISWRFFSPPEKPSLTLRSAKAGSICSSAMASLTSLTQSRSFGASPRVAVAAVRRKLETETPGISTGYCIARNRPARARSSTDMASTSWTVPSSSVSVTLPWVTVYFGWPAIEYASVDLPEPFGPMIAWVSPLLMVRSTPLRISLRSPSASTVTWRLRISRVLMRSGLLLDGVVDVDVDGVAVDLHGVHGDRLGRGEGQRLAGAELELAAVQPAVDDAAVDVALGESDLGVRARVVDREDLVVAPDDRDRDVADADRQGVGVRDVGQGAGAHVAGQVRGSGSGLGHTPCSSSSCSTFATRRASSSSMPTCCSTSWKKPRTTRRRASSTGMPRDCR